jgi:RecB family exonuclease
VSDACGAEPGPDAASLAAALERALLELAVPWHEADDGGVRVLDAVQARAVPCGHLFLIGAVHGAWPRELADDPFLPDRVRQELRSALRRPVPLRGSAGAEDRSLFGLLLAQAREQVTLSWPERDAQGRTLSPSALLRNLPFVAPGTDVVPKEPLPLGSERRFARTPALLPQAQAVLAAGRAQLARTDDPRGADLCFDGAVGAEALPALGPLSPTFLEGLGRCAQRAFFDHVLRARELEQPGPAGLDEAESGRFVHAVLDALYAKLRETGALRPGGSPRDAQARAERLLPEALERAGARFRLDMRARHPSLFDAYLDAMRASIRDFLKRDLETLLHDGVAAIEVEQQIAARIDLESGASLDVEGRIDRIIHPPSGALRVGDYKTGSFKKRLSRAEIRKGRSLQIPLYALAVARSRGRDDVVAEMLLVPRYPQRDRDDVRLEERSLPLADLALEARAPLAAIQQLLARGDFPFREEERACSYCPHTLGCRYAQPESAARSRAAPEREAYFALEDA